MHFGEVCWHGGRGGIGAGKMMKGRGGGEEGRGEWEGKAECCG